MKKSDRSIHNITVAAINRKTIRPYDFKWTEFYHSNSEFLYQGLPLYLVEDEMIICSTIIDSENYSVLTTRKLITVEDGREQAGILLGCTDKGYGIFKKYKGNSVTFGSIDLENGTSLKYFIETGKASIVMIYGVRTAISLQSDF